MFLLKLIIVTDFNDLLQSYNRCSTGLDSTTNHILNSKQTLLRGEASVNTRLY